VRGRVFGLLRAQSEQRGGFGRTADSVEIKVVFSSKCSSHLNRRRRRDCELMID